MHSWCREAEVLSQAALKTDLGSPAWEAYYDHYSDPENPFIQRLVKGEWVPIPDEELWACAPEEEEEEEEQ